MVSNHKSSTGSMTGKMRVVRLYDLDKKKYDGLE